MESLYFEDFELGQEFITRSRTITEADVVAFAGLSGDFNPLHTDEEFAKKTVFGTRIAHGLLGLSIASGLINQLGIAEKTVMAFLGLNWTFKAALKFGDTISVRQRVIEKRETSKTDRGILRLAISVINQHGEVVQEGEHTLMIRRRV
ncbi:MAG TPA: MaoC/PaaZ C-terminal domain-containing protein [Pyrinomonadaceae bacterium]|nr:MaoC/PaaZ C-terminal domain-containing protein [Pyrinomonadaceae bacterium]HLE62511.1 MaoC/PaaZ C-terminal domain-containing protein [Pyrinomonadaceae bacterium]